jgi:uncharacterized membrane protein
MKNIILILLFVLVFPLAARADETNMVETTAPDKTFKAVVTEVIREQNQPTNDNSVIKQQDLQLKGLEGEFKDKVVEYDGIGNVEVIKNNVYKVGDKVLVVASFNEQGGYTYYVTDYVRSGSLLVLFIIFILALLLVGGWKGFRSLLSLVFTFLVIMKYIVPQILDGADPIIVTIIGSFIILFLIIYLTEGFSTHAHVSVVSIFLSLIITVILAKLSGLATEESSFLVGLGTQAINFQGLLMSGIIIGTLGVLDDIVISQVATVQELHKADQFMSRWDLYKRAYGVGISHISSMTNTLFLAYAGASLSLLILFASGQSGFSGWGQAINNEMVATEIVRALAGSVGLTLSVPISTFMAMWWVKRKK